MKEFLSEQEIEEYISSGHVVRNADLEAQWMKDATSVPRRYYNLGDGSVLVVMRGTGRWFSSESAAIADIEYCMRLANEIRGHKPKHMLHGIFPYDQQFPEHTSKLITELAIRLKIDPKLFDLSIESLAVVDSALEYDGGSEIMLDKLFPNVIAYTGETIIRQTGWKWKMKRTVVSNETVWEPNLETEGGTPIIFFQMLYKTAYEHEVVDCQGIARISMVFNKP